METTEPNKEITNEFLYEKSCEFTDLLLKQTDSIRNSNARIWEHVELTYNNVRFLSDITKKLESKIEKLNSKINDLQSDLDALNR